MFVKKLLLKDFRGIKKCKDKIPLSKLTVLIGRNNSGKSTILEALSLLPRPREQEYFTGIEKMKFIISLHRERANTNKPLLYQYSGNSEIWYYFHHKPEPLTFVINESNYQILENAKEMNENAIELFFLQQPSTILKNWVVFIPDDTPYYKHMESRLIHLKEFIMKRGINVSVAKRLNKCVNDRYSDVVFKDQPITLRKIYPDGNFNYINISDLGFGAERAVKIMGLIEAINPKLLLIDDFEVGLHPKLIEILLTWLKDMEWQTVISTHSLDVLHELIEVNPPNTSVLQLYKSDGDILSFNKLTLDELEDLFDGNQDPRKIIDALDLGKK